LLPIRLAHARSTGRTGYRRAYTYLNDGLCEKVTGSRMNGRIRGIDELRPGRGGGGKDHRCHRAQVSGRVPLSIMARHRATRQRRAIVLREILDEVRVAGYVFAEGHGALVEVFGAMTD
jgi:hypothetical protein